MALFRRSTSGAAPSAGEPAEFTELAPWYHRIDLGDGLVTPGTRNQGLVFDLYRELLPSDLSGLTVLDLGANAGAACRSSSPDEAPKCSPSR
jgi:hypothetical protein